MIYSCTRGSASFHNLDKLFSSKALVGRRINLSGIMHCKSIPFLLG
jgi:hypothetical protein